MAHPRTHTIRIDSTTGRLDVERLCTLLADVEEYLDDDLVDTDDEAARLAASMLRRYFGELGGDTTEETWASEGLNSFRQPQAQEEN